MRSALTPVFVCAGLGIVVVAGALVGCPPNPNVQCTSQNDCPIGKACSAEQRCVDQAPPPPPHDAGPVPDGGFEGEGEGAGVGVGEGEGEGEGEGANLQPRTVTTQGDISMFVADPADPSRALVGFSGSLDEELTFDLNAGTFSTPTFDFIAKGASPCGIDNVFVLSQQAAGASLDGNQVSSETWFSCSSGPHVVIEYNNDTINLNKNRTGVTAAEIARVIPSPAPYRHDDLAVKSRVLAVERGGPLQIVPIDPTADQLQQPRTPEAIEGVTLEHVAGVFVLAQDDEQVGDVLLVFDRGTAPKLVPIQRALNATTWHGEPIDGASPNLKTLTLPTDTDAVIFLDDLTTNRSSTASTSGTELLDLAGLSTSTADDDVTNLIVLRPTKQNGGNGEVDFLRYEKELSAPGTSGFDPMPLGAGASDPPVRGADRDRTLLQLVPHNGDTLVFYALTQSPHVWQFRLPHARQDVLTVQDVQRAQLLHIGDKPQGFVLERDPANNDFVLGGLWVALSAQSSTPAANRELDFVLFQGAF